MQSESICMKSAKKKKLYLYNNKFILHNKKYKFAKTLKSDIIRNNCKIIMVYLLKKSIPSTWYFSVLSD